MVLCTKMSDFERCHSRKKGTELSVKLSGNRGACGFDVLSVAAPRIRRDPLRSASLSHSKATVSRLAMWLPSREAECTIFPGEIPPFTINIPKAKTVFWES